MTTTEVGTLKMHRTPGAACRDALQSEGSFRRGDPNAELQEAGASLNSQRRKGREARRESSWFLSAINIRPEVGVHN
jgi:hypothetical protein